MKLLLPGAGLVPAAQVDAMPSQVCASLPSSNSAYDFIQGVPGSGWRVLRDLVFRGVLILPGIMLAGVPFREAVKAALFGSTGIEVFVLLYTDANTGDCRMAVLPPVAGLPAVEVNGQRSGAISITPVT